MQLVEVKDKDKDKDLFIGPQEFVVGYFEGNPKCN